MKETIMANGEAHGVETRPLTLIFHHGMMAISAPERVEINPTTTLQAAKEINETEYAALVADGLEYFFRRVFPGETLPGSSYALKDSILGVQHVIGMLILIREAVRFGRKPFIKFPETYLHPRHQANLADLLAEITARM